MPTLTTQAIAQRVAGQLTGPADLTISGVEHIEHAAVGQVTFIGDEHHARLWPASHASAALVTSGITLDPGPGRALIHVANADLAMALVLELFAPPLSLPGAGIHPTAIVDPTATLGRDVRVGAYCVVGARAVVGEGSILHHHVNILDDSRIGAQCMLWPGVVIRERCSLGDRCILHPNVTIGSDGFGYRPAPDGQSLVKVPQIGTVEIGHDVEIGAGSCVDRAKFSATVIGEGCKIDNLCHIAHNCRLGRSVVMAGQSGLAGSVTLGDGVMMGGQVAIRDHVTVGAGARIAGCSAVIEDMPAGATWAGTPAHDARQALREVAAMRKLPDLIKLLRKKDGG